MKITVIGTGYVGLVTGTCFSEFGFDVTCVDKDKEKISLLRRGSIPIYEPGLQELVEKNIKEGSLKFTVDLKEALYQSDVIFIAVGTPSRRGDGHADLVYVFDVIDELAQQLSHEVVIVTKSTVPVGTGRKIYERLKKKAPNLCFYIASNPEFLREGAAIEDFMNPDRVIVGTESEKAKAVMDKLYAPLKNQGVKILNTSIETAELIKYAANGFLAMKISFINEISDLCEKCGANVEEVATGIGLDERIGRKFLNVGPGYGGSCFPKDTKALCYTAEQYGESLSLIDAVVKSNEIRKKSMGPRVEEILGSVQGKKIGVLGLTFKSNTDDMRDSVSLDILPYLEKKGAILQVYDPKGMDEAKKSLKNITLDWRFNTESVLDDADAVLILTEWECFGDLDFKKVKDLMKKPILIDFRNLYSLKDMERAGMSYYSLGRKNIII